MRLLCLNKAIKRKSGILGMAHISASSHAAWAWCVYLIQFSEGLKVTGMSRDVSWGLYIGQLTYLVGVAAGGVMVVLPYYLHDYKAFGKITILGEFLAIAAIVMCLLVCLCGSW